MVVAVLQMGLAIVLLAASGAKLVRTEDLAGALRLSGVSSLPARLLARLVPVVEIAVALMLLMARDSALGVAFLIALGVVATFTSWLLWVRFGRVEIRCNCFGASSRKVTAATILRNGFLMSAAAAGLVLADSRGTALPEVSFFWTMTTICIAATVLLLAAFNQVRHGLILSLDSLQQRRKLSAGIKT